MWQLGSGRWRRGKSFDLMHALHRVGEGEKFEDRERDEGARDKDRRACAFTCRGWPESRAPVSRTPPADLTSARQRTHLEHPVDLLARLLLRDDLRRLLAERRGRRRAEVSGRPVDRSCRRQTHRYCSASIFSSATCSSFDAWRSAAVCARPRERGLGTRPIGRHWSGTDRAVRAGRALPAAARPARGQYQRAA
jgi:hypothetical protein